MDIQPQPANLILENRPLGLAKTWQNLINYAVDGQYADCRSFLDSMILAASPFSAEEFSIMREWEGLLFEYLGLRCHKTGYLQSAQDCFLRSKVAFKDVKDWISIQRLFTLEWVLAGMKSSAQAAVVLEKYIDDAARRVNGINPIELILSYLKAETGNWKSHRSALEALVDLREWNLIASIIDQLPLRSQRDALILLFEVKAPLSPDWQVDCIRNKNNDKDWFVRMMAARFMVYAEKCKMSDEDWENATWDNHFLVRAEIARSLEKWRPKAVVSYLLSLLPDNSLDVRIAVLEAMMEVRDSRFIQAVKNVGPLEQDIIGRSFETFRQNFLKRYDH